MDPTSSKSKPYIPGHHPAKMVFMTTTTTPAQNTRIKHGQWADHPLWTECHDFTSTMAPWYPTVEMHSRTLSYLCANPITSFSCRPTRKFITEVHWRHSDGVLHSVSRSALNKTFHLLIERVENMHTTYEQLRNLLEVLGKKLSPEESTWVERPLHHLMQRAIPVCSLAWAFGKHLAFLSDIERGTTAMPDEWWIYPFAMDIDALYGPQRLWVDREWNPKARDQELYGTGWYFQGNAMSDFAFRVAEFVEKNGGLGFCAEDVALMGQVRSITEQLRGRLSSGAPAPAPAPAPPPVPCPPPAGVPPAPAKGDDPPAYETVVGLSSASRKPSRARRPMRFAVFFKQRR